MKIILKENGMHFIPETPNEKGYLKTVLERILWIFNPEVTAILAGVRVTNTLTKNTILQEKKNE